MEKHFSKTLVLTIMMILLNYGVTIAQDYSDSQTSKPPSAFRINPNDKGSLSQSAPSKKPKAQDTVISLLEMSKSRTIIRKERDPLQINIPMNNNKILREGEEGFFRVTKSPSDLEQITQTLSSIDAGNWPSIAHSSNGDLYVALNVIDTFQSEFVLVYIYKSVDGGVTWSYWGGFFNTGFDLLFPDIEVIDDRIVVSFTEDNDVWIFWDLLDQTDFAFVEVTTTGNVTMGTGTSITSDDRYYSPSVVYLYLAYADEITSEIHYTYSIDFGSTWTVPVAISGSSIWAAFRPGSAISFASTNTLGDQIFISWRDADFNGWISSVFPYSPGTYFASIVLPSFNDPTGWGFWAPNVVSNGDNIFLITHLWWGESYGGNIFDDIAFTFSYDGGDTWDVAYFFPDLSDIEQTLPAINSSEDNIFGFIYYEDNDKIVAMNNDGVGFLGTWTEPTILEDLSSDFWLGSVVVSDGKLRAAWDDGSGGQVYYGDLDLSTQSSITVLSPNGGESWEVGSSQDITWTWEGSISNVKIEYSTNGGSTWSIISSSTANDGSYLWTVPSPSSSTSLVRISDVTDPSVIDQSDAVFEIYSTSISLVSPNGGESWEVGSSQDITWTWEGSISNVKIEYSTNGGSTWSIISSSTANDGSYLWTVPSPSSSTSLVRISDVTDPSVIDQSDAVFEIYSTSISLVSPNGGESWEVGSSQDITWTWEGSISNVKIEYSTNGGSTWSPVSSDTNSTPNDGSYLWTIPSPASSTCLVKIYDASSPSISDQSDSVFEIKASSISLVSPNGGEIWEVGDTHEIVWTSGGPISDVRIDFSLNAGSTWSTVSSSTPNDGSYPWTVPLSISSTCLVKISDVTDPTVVDQSDSVFEIFDGTSTITSISDVPYDQGKQVLVVWTASIIEGKEVEPSVSSYSLWRRSETTNNALVNNNQENILVNGISWSFIVSMPIEGFEEYSYVAPTLRDSTGDGMFWSTFMVSAHTTDPTVFFHSDPDSGYSIDNLAPAAPGGLMAQQLAGNEIALTWEQVTDADFDYYKVYRSTESNIDPFVTDALFEISDTTVTDTEVEIGITYYYLVSAVDYNGNEGSPSEEINTIITSINSEGIIPDEYNLDQNFPNPFNPVTVIRFALVEASEVDLIVYNLRGERVANLVKGKLEAGYHEVSWDGSSVASGVYLYRFRANGFIQTRKMLLLK